MHNRSFNDLNENLFKGLVEEIRQKGLPKAMELSNIEKFKKVFTKISSSSALRKVYDAYLEFYDKDGQEYDLHKTLWIAKIAYQEKRNQGGLPSGFSKFIEEVDNLLGDKELFKKFLEMFVAYHKYFNPNAK